MQTPREGRPRPKRLDARDDSNHRRDGTPQQPLPAGRRGRAAAARGAGADDNNNTPGAAAANNGDGRAAARARSDFARRGLRRRVPARDDERVARPRRAVRREPRRGHVPARRPRSSGRDRRPWTRPRSATCPSSGPRRRIWPDGNRECCVCLEAQEVGDRATKLPCGHLFHTECVVQWLRKHGTCPSCRYELNRRTRPVLRVAARAHGAARAAAPPARAESITCARAARARGARRPRLRAGSTEKADLVKALIDGGLVQIIDRRGRARRDAPPSRPGRSASSSPMADVDVDSTRARRQALPRGRDRGVRPGGVRGRRRRRDGAGGRGSVKERRRRGSPRYWSHEHIC